MTASEVKKGDRVVFVTGDNQEFNGIALSDAKINVHPGVKRAGIYLDIVYLDASGASVKVLSAPVLKDAVGDDDLKRIVELEHGARSRDHRRSSLQAFGGDVDEASLRQEFLELKQSSGWKPFGTDRDKAIQAEADLVRDWFEGHPDSAVIEELAARSVDARSSLASVTAERDDLKDRFQATAAQYDAVASAIATVSAERDRLKDECAGLESAVLGLQSQLADTTEENAALKAKVADLQERLDSAARVAMTETPVIEAGLAAGATFQPSADDLDAVAAEQRAADATSTANTESASN